MSRPFCQVDVFPATALGGNPVAVVLDGDGLDDDVMQAFARWTNLSETTFVVPPTDPAADYRVRILTPAGELPFAGHPTLGTCHAWLSAGGVARSADVVVQQCAVGLIPIRRVDTRLAFGAPPLRRTGAVESEVLSAVTEAFGIDAEAVLAAEWVDNGPGWMALLLDSPDTVLAVQPRAAVDHKVGLAALYPGGSDVALEVRALVRRGAAMIEDPVTGSLNASLAQWLTSSGRVEAPYVAAQGRIIGHAGHIHISRDPDGQIWVAGDTATRITGTVNL